MNTQQNIKTGTRMKRKKQFEGTGFFNDCADLLHGFHQGMNLFNAASGNEVPDHESHRRTTTNISRTEDFIHKVIEREMFTYDRTSPDKFSALQTQRREIKNYPLFGIKVVSTLTTHFFQTQAGEILIQVDELHSSSEGEAPQQFPGKITIQINALQNN